MSFLLIHKYQNLKPEQTNFNQLNKSIAKMYLYAIYKLQ